MTTARQEIDAGRRFAFGRNWSAFLSSLDEARVLTAEASLKSLLGLETLDAKRFLDVGSGSGLFSLAARRLGAEVLSFDFDDDSVACTETLRERFFPDDGHWQVRQGSVLDPQFLAELGQYDVVYSWGVLHHTGQMWMALENVCSLVKPGGLLAVALYNDQGPLSQFWLRVKRAYCSGPVGKALMSAVFVPYFFSRTLVVSLLRRKNLFRTYRQERGMSLWHDWHDWLGGLPFESARPEAVFQFFRRRGFDLEYLITTNGLGCNQFVFRKPLPAPVRGTNHSR